jgi:hypothetical protein
LCARALLVPQPQKKKFLSSSASLKEPYHEQEHAFGIASSKKKEKSELKLLRKSCKTIFSE